MAIDDARFQLLLRWATERTIVCEDARKADVLVFPHNWEPGAAADRAILAARRADRPLAFFTETDLNVPALLPPTCTLFRTSLSASRRSPREHAHPAWILDPLPGGVQVPRDYEAEPSVGFCGHTLHLWRSLKYVAGRWPMLRGLWLRRRALAALERAPGVRCEFIRRDHLIGPRLWRWRTDPTVAGARDEFVRTLLSTDYGLCVRGAGNFSIRFFETLAAGRIPLLIDTDCVLPLDDEIDWSRHVCRVPASEMSRAGETLRAFHARHTPGSFTAMQLANRRLYEERLTPDRFYEWALARAAGIRTDWQRHTAIAEGPPAPRRSHAR